MQVLKKKSLLVRIGHETGMKAIFSCTKNRLFCSQLGLQNTGNHILKL